MKAVAASSIGQYERSVAALGDYYKTVELGLAACFREMRSSSVAMPHESHNKAGVIGAIVFGSDQGLVGQFNEVVAEFAIKTLTAFPAKPHIWSVGERVQTCLADAGMQLLNTFPLPSSVNTITPLVRKIQIESEAHRARGEYATLYVFHNQPRPGALYEPVCQKLLPLDAKWQNDLSLVPWPDKIPPQILCKGSITLRGLIREYLFISLFRACAESLASENASRLAAMQRAEKNIGDSLDTLNSTFHRVRQSGIDEELFDVISGFEALTTKIT
jgi:F-type H+-transporting ATPase subunit gamma